MKLRVCSFLLALSACAVSRGGSLVSVYRSVTTETLIKAFSGGAKNELLFDETFSAGPTDWVYSSNVSLGESFAFASSQHHSDVRDGRFTMQADADTGGFAATSRGGEGTPVGLDFVAAFGETLMGVHFTVASAETWQIDVEASGFDSGYFFVSLTPGVPIDGGAGGFEFDTRLGHMSLHESVTLEPGDYFFDVVCTSDFGPQSVGGLWFGDVTFERQVAPVCPGDANGDNVVDFLDLNIVLSFFGQSVAAGTSGDLNGDGVVDFLDLNIVLSFFGTAC